MPVSGLALAASAGLRAASLNLCTDELLLLLARPEEIVSVSHLARSEHESSFWRQARRYSANAGTLESVVAFRPTLVLTMGGGGGDSGGIARRLGVRLLDITYASTLDDVERQALTVAAALGDRRRALPLLRELRQLRQSQPAVLADAAWIGGGGQSLDPESLGAQWLALAGYKQRALPGGRLSLETLATSPPKWLIRSNYRFGQYSLGQAWLSHPLVRRQASRTRVTYGRPWTCAGLPLIAEIRRLRSQTR